MKQLYQFIMRYKAAIIAFLFIFLLALWMLKDGYAPITPKEELEEKAPIDDSETNSKNTAFAVDIKNITPVEYQPIIYSTGITAPSKSTIVKAGITARINKVHKEELDILSKGSIIVDFDKGAYPALLQADEAALQLAEKQYSAAQKLQKKGFEGDISLSSMAADLAQTKANVVARKAIIKELTIKAPFNGVITELYAEDSDYVKVGDRIAAYVSLNPLWVDVWLSVDDASVIDKALGALVNVNGEKIQANIKDIGLVGNDNTRSIKVRLSMANPNYKIASNIPLQVSLFEAQKLLYPVPNDALSVNSDGELGIKMVDTNNKVIFMAANIVSNDLATSYIDLHLGEAQQNTPIRLITVGHSFVQAGDTIE